MGARRSTPPVVPGDQLYTADPSRPARVRRTWPQRLVLLFNSIVTLALLVGAGAVWSANRWIGDRGLIDIGNAGVVVTTLAEAPITPSPPPTSLGEVIPETTAAPTTLPPPKAVAAKNILITASDSRGCIDQNSPYAAAFGNVAGERADTIMLLRVDPTNQRAAVLSFPRDLWVKVGRRNNRINAALDKDNPAKLITTIAQNFYLGVDHWINIDFCAFKDLVAAVGGVAVPFEFAARDRNTGLDIPEPECHLFGGEEALAYVRSRHYQYFDPNSGKWKSDPTGDLGRIERQQDFLKRAMGKALDRWLSDPGVAKGLIDTALKNVITDSELTPGLMLDVAHALRNFDAATVRTFQVESSSMKVNDASVQRPIINSNYMKQVLAVFRGQVTVAEAEFIEEAPPASAEPALVEPPATTPSVATSVPPAAGSSAASLPGATSTTAAPTTAPATTVPSVALEEQVIGISPPADPSCR